MKPKLRNFLFAFLITIVAGCAFVPKVSHDQEYALQCKMFTRSLNLEAEALDIGDCSDPEVCLVAWGIIVPTISLLVSGSIVLAGNAVHWLEYQGRCDDSEFSQHIRRLKKKIDS